MSDLSKVAKTASLVKQLSKEKKDHAITAAQLSEKVKECMMLHEELRRNGDLLQYLQNQLSDVWRDIENAPKEEGIPLILYGYTYGEVSGKSDAPQYALGMYEYGKWYAFPTDKYSVEIEPTHYLHLPCPPIQQEV